MFVVNIGNDIKDKQVAVLKSKYNDIEYINCRSINCMMNNDADCNCCIFNHNEYSRKELKEAGRVSEEDIDLYGIDVGEDKELIIYALIPPSSDGKFDCDKFYCRSIRCSDCVLTNDYYHDKSNLEKEERIKSCSKALCIR